MTTIQDRIIKDFNEKLNEYNHILWDHYVNSNPQTIDLVEIKKPLKKFLIQSIKEVQEETKKEVINHIDFFADQSRWFVDEDDGVSPIIQTRVIAVEDLQKKLLSITNKEDE